LLSSAAAFPVSEIINIQLASSSARGRERHISINRLAAAAHGEINGGIIVDEGARRAARA